MIRIKKQKHRLIFRVPFIECIDLRSEESIADHLGLSEFRKHIEYKSVKVHESFLQFNYSSMHMNSFLRIIVTKPFRFVSLSYAYKPRFNGFLIERNIPYQMIPCREETRLVAKIENREIASFTEEDFPKTFPELKRKISMMQCFSNMQLSFDYFVNIDEIRNAFAKEAEGIL